MKKITSIILAFAVCASLLAQTEGSSSGMVSKKGINILPEQGEIAVGMNATPFLAYIGGFFSGAGAGAPTVNFAQNIANTNAFYVKYMLSENSAIRVHFNYAHGNNTALFTQPKSTLSYDPMHPEYVQDEVTNKNNNFLLGLGYEGRRGKGRVQGYYGAEVLIGKSSNLTDYKYGNAIDGNFNTPAIHNAYIAGGQRVTSDLTSNAFIIGLRPYIGVEYFVAAKVSLGGEFGYAMVVNKDINRTTVYEYWDGASNKVQSVKTESTLGGFHNKNMGADNLFGAINVFFYF
jgi:hypothetical protein